MATLTFKINQRTKAGKAFMVMAETFFKDAEGIEIITSPKESAAPELTAKDQAYLKQLRQAAKEAKEIGAGTRKAQSLQSFLDEL